MAAYDRVSTGLKGFDQVIDNLRWGDNVVWQVDSVSDYKKMAEPYVRQAKIDNRKLVYVRFGRHEPVIEDAAEIKTYFYDAKKGFESFAAEVYEMVEKEGTVPVDIEFTANFSSNGRFRINLLQCRPLQTRGPGSTVDMPVLRDKKDCFFSSKGNFMGGNVRLPVDYVVFVRPKAYLNLSERDKYSVARHIGLINARLKGKNVMLIGPGRWGTGTPSLGVPVHFSELNGMAVVCELSSPEEGFMPELSYGSHFFQDLVETGIFYAAIFDGQEDVVFNAEKVLGKENRLAAVVPQAAHFSDIIHIAETDGMEIFSDIVSQRLLCR